MSYRKNDGLKLLHHWIKHDFVDLSQVLKRLEDLKIAVKANIETRRAFLDSNTFDPKRFILRPTQLFLVQYDLIDLDKAMQKFCTEDFPLLIKSSPEILLSLTDGSVQERHTDYRVESLVDIEKAKLCRICILAVSGTASIMVYKSNGYGPQVIKINAGDLFIGRGSLIHNGMSYDIENLRIHWYLDCVQCGREEDTSYPIGLNVENFYKSRCVKPCLKYREEKKKKKDFMKVNIQKLHRLRRSA